MCLGSWFEPGLRQLPLGLGTPLLPPWGSCLRPCWSMVGWPGMGALAAAVVPLAARQPWALMLGLCCPLGGWGLGLGSNLSESSGQYSCARCAHIHLNCLDERAMRSETNLLLSGRWKDPLTEGQPIRPFNFPFSFSFFCHPPLVQHAVRVRSEHERLRIAAVV